MKSRSREVEQSRVKSRQMFGFSTLVSDSLTPRLSTPRLLDLHTQSPKLSAKPNASAPAALVPAKFTMPFVTRPRR